MKVAIVGSSHIKTRKQEDEIRSICKKILKDFIPNETTIITGGAKGVDTIAQYIGLILGFAVKPIFPVGFGTKANLERNLEIAKECDKLFCISTPVHDKNCYHHKPHQDHEKTAGCWTMNKALEFGKTCVLLITEENKK